MNLSFEQSQALERGEPVFVTFEGIRCVVVREDVFDLAGESRENAEFPPEDLPASATTARMIASIMADDDAEDPALDSYQQYKKQR